MNKAPFAAMREAHRSGDLKPQDGTSPFYRSKNRIRLCRGNVPVILMSGVIEDREELVAAGFAETICINDGCSSLENPSILPWPLVVFAWLPAPSLADKMLNQKKYCILMQ